MQYEAPASVKEACSLLANGKGKAVILAGGTDLLVRMKGEFIEPDLVIDIKRIARMKEIRKTAAGFEIGAAVSCAELGENAALKKAWPGVVEAANLIGSKQIQSRCTMVGNLSRTSEFSMILRCCPAAICIAPRDRIRGPLCSSARANDSGRSRCRHADNVECET